MKNKFRIKRRYVNIIIYLLCVISLVAFLLYPTIQDNINNMLVYKLNNKLNNTSKIKSLSKEEYVYLSLNKIVTFDNNITHEEEITSDNIIDIIINKPIVYIYNTHQSESYDYLKLDHTVKPTVLFASYILKDYLNDYNIESIVEKSSISEYLSSNNLKYSDSYKASRYYMKNAINKYSTIKYYFDIHRDSSKINKTLYEKDGKRYARIMFVVGLNHNNSKDNMKFVEELNNRINDKYKGLSRGIYERKESKFNQDISDKCILIELGGVDNTLEEINNTLEVFASIFNEYLEDNNGI